MLKSIAVSDVQLGMFIHKFEARWFDHPFWKSRFLLDDEESLQEIRLSGLRGVVIDTAKGRDVMPSVPPTPASEAPCFPSTR